MISFNAEPTHELEAKFREKRAVLEAKYEKLYQPFYAKVIVTVKIPAFVCLSLLLCRSRTGLVGGDKRCDRPGYNPMSPIS